MLDRTKEPGAVGEPLYLDVVTALREARDGGFSSFDREPRVVGGRYGLSSKEFTPAMVKAVFDELAKEKPRNHFTVGIVDDVTHTSLAVRHELDIEPDGRGARPSSSASAPTAPWAPTRTRSRSSARRPTNFAQGYFVYDSKKAGRDHDLAPAVRPEADPVART